MEYKSLGHTKLVLIMAVGLLALMLLCFSNASAAPMSGAFIDTNNNGVLDIGEYYSSHIQNAIDNATPGQTIIILPGTYAEQITIAKDGLRIIGSGNDTTSIVAFNPLNVSFSYNAIDYHSIVTVNATGVSISNLTVDGLRLGTANAGIGYWNASGSLDHVTVQGINYTSNLLGDYSGIIVFTDNYLPVDFRMANSTVTGSLTNDVTIATAYVNAVFQSDLFSASPSGAPQNGLLALDSASVTVQSCTFNIYSMGGTDPTGAISAGIRSIGSGVSISDSRFLRCDIGVLAVQGSADVAGSFFQANTFGIVADASFVTINSNIIQGSINSGVYAYATSNHLSSFVTLTFNDISLNKFGVYAKNNSGYVSLDARYNNITDNVVGAFSDLNATIFMLYNWWGSSTGPYNDTLNMDGSGNPVNGTLEFTPWLNGPFGTGSPYADVFIDTNQNYVYDDLIDLPFYQIQAAIDAAVPGDWIKVEHGNYTEQLVINKDSLSLLGTQHSHPPGDSGSRGLESTISYSAGGPVISIGGNAIEINGFMVVQGGSSPGDVGIFVGGRYFQDVAHQSYGNTILTNIVTGGTSGIYVWMSSSNSILNNRVTGSSDALITLAGDAVTRETNNNLISNNYLIATGLTNSGIMVISVGPVPAIFRHNEISFNTISTSGAGAIVYGVYLSGAEATSSDPMLIQQNLINGKITTAAFRTLDSDYVRLISNTVTTGVAAIIANGSLANNLHLTVSLNTITVDSPLSFLFAVDILNHYQVLFSNNTVTVNFPAGSVPSHIIANFEGIAGPLLIDNNTFIVNGAGSTNAFLDGVHVVNPKGATLIKDNVIDLGQVGSTSSIGLYVNGVSSTSGLSLSVLRNIIRNALTGIDIISIPTAALVGYNQVTGFALAGIKLEGTGSIAMISFNTITGLGAATPAVNSVGIDIVGGAYADVISNTIKSVGSTIGISISFTDSNGVASSNTITWFSTVGILVNGASIVMIDNNVITGNGTASAATQWGIIVQNGAEADIVQNTITSTGTASGGAILVESSSIARTDHNTISAFGMIGVDVSASQLSMLGDTITGGGGYVGAQMGVYAVNAALLSIDSCVFSALDIGAGESTDASSIAVFAMQTDPGLSIANCLFSGNDIGIYINSADGSITGSTFLNNMMDISIDSSFVTIDHNTMTGSRYGVYAYAQSGSSSYIVLTNNDITTHVYAVYVRNLTGMVILTALDNNLGGNIWGAFNQMEPIDMRFNYWGDASGPFNPTSNPSGLGSDVADNVTFSPWLAFPVGTVPQTYVVSGTSIQDAIDFAASGDTVLILPGTYAEQLTITKSLNLVGSGNATTIITAFDPMQYRFSYGGVSYYAIITVEATIDVTIRDLTVNGLGFANAGIGFRNAQGVVRNVTVQGISAPANVLGDYSGIIVFTDNLVPVNFQLIDSTLTGALSSEVTIASAYVNAVITSDQFFGSPVATPICGVIVRDLAVANIRSCLFFNYALSGGVTDPAGPLSAGIVAFGADLTVAGCSFTACNAGILVDQSTAIVTGSTFTGNLVDIEVVSSVATISGNIMPGSTYGVYVYAIPSLSSSVLMTLNDISGNQYGVYVANGGGSVTLDAHDNNITDNVVGAFNELPTPIVMLYNWWGSSTGPYNDPLNMDGFGNPVSANVLFTPWLDGPVSVGVSYTDVYNDRNFNHVYDDGIDTPYYQIQTAIDDAIANDWIGVNHGNYSETLTINVAGLQLFGPNYVVNPNTGVRALEAKLEPGAVDTASGVVITVTASDVVITGFTITGSSSYFILGGETLNSVQSYAHSGIEAIGQVSNLVVRNNIVRDLQIGVAVLASGTVNGVMINQDLFSNILLISPGGGEAVKLVDANDAIVQSDVFTECYAGVGVYAPTNAGTILIQNNVYNGPTGLSNLFGVIIAVNANAIVRNNQFLNLHCWSTAAAVVIYNGGHVVEISNNTVTGVYDQIDITYGVLIQGPLGSVGDVRIIYNTISNVVKGISVIDVNGGVVIEHNVLNHNVRDGVYMNDAQNVTVMFNNITNNGFAGIESVGFLYNDVANWNNIVGNIVYGATNTDNEHYLDARFNWWGDISGAGPIGGDGSGDNISQYIEYVPWLNARYPGGTPISGGLSGTIHEGDPMDAIVSMGIYVSMEGAGYANISIERYASDPVGPTPYTSADSFVDLMLANYSGVTQITLRVYYNPLTLPLGIDEGDLRMYWWNGVSWSSCSDSGVNLASHYVWANIRTNTLPSLLQLTGTIFGLGTANITLTPDSGLKGTFVTLTGSGFSINDTVQVLFGGAVIGIGTTNAIGDLNPIGVVIPQVLAGVYFVTVVDSHGVFDIKPFTVLDDTPIIVTIDVGALHFIGEIVSWYATTTINGHLADVDTLNATMYGPAGYVLYLTSSVTRISTGVYIITATIPMIAAQGDYAMVLNASKAGTHFGASVTVFVISPTLTDYGARLVAIQDDTAYIITTLGLIRIDLSYMNATIISIMGTVVDIQTELGIIHATVDQIHATVISINGTVVQIHTDLGYVNVTVDDIHAKIIAIQGTLVTIHTDLGYVNATVDDIHAIVVSIDGTVVQIQTELGIIHATVDQIHATVVSINGTVVHIQTDLGYVNVTVNDIHARIIDIQGTLVTIHTDLGYTNATVNDIHARIIDIQGTLVTIHTDLGYVNATVDDINAIVVSINGTVVHIQTDLGYVNATVDDIHAIAISIDGTVVQIHTDLGYTNATVNDIHGIVVFINGTVVQIQTDIGVVQTSLDNIQATILRIDGNLTLVSTIIGDIWVGVQDINATVSFINGTTVWVRTTVGSIQTTVGSIDARLISIQGDIAYINTTLGMVRVTLNDVHAILVSVNGTIDGINSTVFQINTTVGNILVGGNAINATVTAIRTEMNTGFATIQTTLGEIEVTLGQIKATVDHINGTTVTINTTLGTIIVSVTDIDARLVTLVGDVAMVNTTLGMVNTTVNNIGSMLVDLNGTTAQVWTTVGAINVTVNQINAKIESFNGTMVEIWSTVGSLNVSLSAIDAKVTSIQGSIATISTSFGNLTGRVTALENGTAIIETDLGKVKLDVASMENKVTGMGDGSMIWIIVFAIGLVLVFLFAVVRTRSKN